MTTKELEQKVVNLLNPIQNPIVPNVSWGLPGLRHECDLLMLDKQHRFTEIELKISKSDLQADFKKKHGHKCKHISRLVYAVPEALHEFALKVVPKECGLIVADDSYYARWIRVNRHNANRPTEDVVLKFLKLGAIRIWKSSRVVEKD